MAHEQQDYRTILRQELVARCRSNPRYSLRAFARDLDISPSRLSEILSGKHGLSRSRAEVIGKRLGMNNDEAQCFRDLVLSQHPRSKILREAARERLASIQQPPAYLELSLDAFRLIGDWYHLAIIELFHIKDFNVSASSIARALGINTDEARDALERLVRIGLISRDGSKFRVNSRDNRTTSDVPSAAIRQAHEQLLRKAIEALYAQTVDERDFGCIEMAFDPARMAEAKEAIRRFRRDFDKKFGHDASAAAVFCFATQFFRLSTEGISDV